MPIFWLDEKLSFPDPRLAEDDGIIAVGGDLSPQRLFVAYQQGIFPWFNPDDPPLWWCPDPRCVLFPDEIKVSKSMRPYFNQPKYTVTYNTCFDAVIRSCQQQYRPSQGNAETWITTDIIEGYTALHQQGYAHSVEVWKEQELVGGLYGVAIGKVFFGESMFAKMPNASKFGFISAVRLFQQKGIQLIDCQQETKHLLSLGARNIPREDFLGILEGNSLDKLMIE